MFVDLATAHRIEAAEAAVMRAMAGAHVGAGHAFVRDVAGGLATFVRVGSPMNKVIGAGLDAPIGAAELAALAQAFHAAGECVRCEVATVAAPETHAELTAAGYQLTGFEHALVRRLEPSDAGDAPPAIVVEAATTPAQVAAYREAVLEGFLVEDGTGAVADTYTREVVTTVIDDVLAAPGFVRYIAAREGELAGGASMFVHAGVAVLTGSATLPPHRRRGVQAALLRRRLADARAAGADLAIITTSPGTQSQANVMKQGFALAYARAVLVLAAP